MRYLLISMLAALLPLAAAPVQAEGKSSPNLSAGPIALRASVTVDGEIVRLGDLFRNIGARARVAVAYAPEPGKEAVLNAEWLIETARLHQIAWRPRSRFERLVIRRASVPVERPAISLRIAERLRAKGLQGDVRVALDLRQQTVHLPVAVSKGFAITELRYNKRSGRIVAKLVAPANNPTYTLRLTGRLQRLIEVPVLTRRIRRGAIIRARDVVLHKLDRARVASATVLDRTNVVGLAARRTLRRGEPLNSGDLRAPVLVRRGALVTMEIQTSQMRLTARGKALESGSRGDTVRIRNIQSKRVIEGTVVGADRVRIKHSGPLAARQK